MFYGSVRICIIQEEFVINVKFVNWKALARLKLQYVSKINVCITLWLPVIQRTMIAIMYQILICNNFVLTPIIQWVLLRCSYHLLLSTCWIKLLGHKNLLNDSVDME